MLTVAGWVLPCAIARAHIVLSADPLRPARPPIEPMTINGIQDVIVGRDVEESVSWMLQARSADPDYQLTDNEERRMSHHLRCVAAARDPLMGLLQAAVGAAPWVAKYGTESDFGLGDAADPYVRSCRAECLLALLILHAEGGPVDFIDADRLEVLRGGADAEPRLCEQIRAVSAELAEP